MRGNAGGKTGARTCWKPGGKLGGKLGGYPDRRSLSRTVGLSVAIALMAGPTVLCASDLSGLVGEVMALEGDREYGAYLAGECSTCHQLSGHTGGVPQIVGLPKDYFIEAIFAYKTKVRSNEVMTVRVENLSHEEIAALAAYYHSLSPH